MTQTIALFVDAYRELNSRKLFWVTLFLSGIVVAAMAAFGINERGLTFLWWTIDLEGLNSTWIPAKTFYAIMFANIGIPIWLTWVAMILALISTASIFPDFIAGGAIEMTLSKPISRLRLFLTKYMTGLLFVAMQVGVFSLACFLMIGLRGGSWQPRVLLAVPIVLLVFSYLYSVCVLAGLLTRSTIAAVLATMVFWVFLWALNTVDAIFLIQREVTVVNAERSRAKVERLESAATRELERRRSAGEATPDPSGLPAGATDVLEAVNPFLAGARSDARESAESEARWRRWTGYVIIGKTVFPKTEDTTNLLDRWLLSDAEKALLVRDEPDSDGKVRFMKPDAEVHKRVEAALRSRTVPWIIATSLGFEVVVIGLGALVFCRRDF